MRYRIIPTALFEKEFKRLAKKYPSLKADLKALRSELQVNPGMGIPLGKGCYKIRLAIKSKGKGKSGGGRVITFLYLEVEAIILLTIYDKSEFESIRLLELTNYIKTVKEKLDRMQQE